MLAASPVRGKLVVLSKAKTISFCDPKFLNIVVSSSSGVCYHDGMNTNHRATFRDLTGQTLGRWTVLGYSHTKSRIAYYRCRCSCGQERIVNAGSLRSGRSASCGCLHREVVSMKAHKHGHAGNEQHPLYTVWAQMLSRCSCPTANGYERYGGRGIKVCERWRTSFEDFLADMGPRPTPRHTLDRFPDNDGDYEPGNVRWATPAEQNRNKRSNRLLTHDGVMRCLTDWATTTGLSAGTITMRLQLGWTVADALS